MRGCQGRGALSEPRGDGRHVSKAGNAAAGLPQPATQGSDTKATSTSPTRSAGPGGAENPRGGRTRDIPSTRTSRPAANAPSGAGEAQSLGTFPGALETPLTSPRAPEDARTTRRESFRQRQEVDASRESWSRAFPARDPKPRAGARRRGAAGCPGCDTLHVAGATVPTATACILADLRGGGERELVERSSPVTGVRRWEDRGQKRAVGEAAERAREPRERTGRLARKRGVPDRAGREGSHQAAKRVNVERIYLLEGRTGGEGGPTHPVRGIVASPITSTSSEAVAVKYTRLGVERCGKGGCGQPRAPLRRAVVR